jgi:hypothetical protein
METFDTQISNLYSEDDFLRHAAQKNFEAKGFDRKAFSEAVHPKEKQMNDSAIGHAIPASYYYDDINDGFGSGGAMSPPGGAYYQAKENEQEKEPPKATPVSMIKDLYTNAIIGAKEGIYKYATQWPILLRNKIMSKFTKKVEKPSVKDKILNFISSLYPMGGDCGAIERMLDDWKDRLEIIIDDDYRVLGFRRYTDRDPNAWYVKLLKKEVIERGQYPIPRYGRAAKTVEDFDFNEAGQITGYKRDSDIRGQLLRPDQVRFDDFYWQSDTENIVTHGEAKTSSPTKFRDNMVQWTLSHYVYTQGSAKKESLGTVKVRGRDVQIFRLDMPYGIHRFDPALMIKTIGTAIGIYVTHFLYSALEKGYLKAGDVQAAKNMEQMELDFMFGSYRPLRPAAAYA